MDQVQLLEQADQNPLYCHFCLRTQDMLGPKESIQEYKINLNNNDGEIILCTFCNQTRIQFQKFLPKIPDIPTADFDQGSVFLRIPLIDNTEYPVYQSDVVEWGRAYPAVNVPVAIQRMRQWLLSNPTKRKTRRGARRFITGWLERSQNWGGDKNGKTVQPNGKSDGRPLFWPK